MVNIKQVVCEPIKYVTFLIYVTWECSWTLSEEKQNVHIFIQVYKRGKSGKWKILKNEAAEKYLEPCQISIMERFCNIDVWYSSKYTPEVVLDSKIYLKQRNIKMLEKTVYFFNVDLAEGTAM